MIFPYGTVLKVQREYTNDDILHHLEKIKNIGMNFVVIWPSFFWWDNIDDENYPFRTGIRILEYAETLGLKIILELAGQLTSLEYVPDFLMKDEFLVMDIDGHYTEFRGGYCPLNYNHPDVKTIMREKFSAACRTYKNYPALYGYDIWNETQLTSFDPHTLCLFRQWLKDKYESLDALNASWDREYRCWTQIKFTRWNWASVMPYVDYQEFKKDNIGIILSEWSEIIKEVDPDHPVIADNVSSMITDDSNYMRPQDDWNVAENVDEFGVSFYPKNLSLVEPYSRWQTLSGAFSATASGRFWISELQSHHATMFLPNTLVYPHEVKLWNWEAISHGAKGIIYWKWHPFIKGYQTSSRGLVNYRDEYSPRAIEALYICKTISENDHEFFEYEPEKTRAGILYDRLSHEFSKAYTDDANRLYVDAMAGLYKCLWENNIPARYFTPAQILDNQASNLKILFITEQINISDDLAGILMKYVFSGGVIVYDGKFGETDNNGILSKNIPGGKLNQILGYHLEDIDILDMDIQCNLGEASLLPLRGYFEKRIFKITGLEVDILGRFNDGRPAILRTKYGTGQIIGVATHLWYGYFNNECGNVKDFIKAIHNVYKISPYATSHNILKIATLKGNDGIILFAFNYLCEEIAESVTLYNLNNGRYVIRNIQTNDQYPIDVCNNKTDINVCVNGNDVLMLKFEKKDL